MKVSTVLIFSLLVWTALVQLSMQDDNITLILGPNSYSGLVQITHQGRTGLVCDDYFNTKAGAVVCRQLGYPTHIPRIVTAGKFHAMPSGMTYILDDVKCVGNESKLSECVHDPWYSENCGDDETVAVFCDYNPCASGVCHHGDCIKLTNSTVNCTCHPGYTGTSCDVDINECVQNNGGCSHQCVNTASGYTCNCPDVELTLSQDNHTCTGVGETVTCTSQSMMISFAKVHFPGLQAQYVTLTDTSCRATQNQTHIIITSPLDGCGTRSKKVGGNIIYENTVKSRETVVDGVISRVREIEVPYQCAVKTSSSLQVPLTVDSRTLTFTAEGHAQFDTRLELFHDPHYRTPGENPFHSFPGDNVYVEVTINSNGSDLTPLAVRCDATPTQNITYKVYNLIDNGCARDATVQFLQTATNRSGEHFTFETFKYLDNSPAVFLHCDVTVCMASDAASRCRRGCVATNPGKRSPRDTMAVVQPEYIPQDAHGMPLGSKSSTLLLTGSVTSVISAVILVAAIVYRKYSPPKHNQKY